MPAETEQWIQRPISNAEASPLAQELIDNLPPVEGDDGGAQLGSTEKFDPAAAYLLQLGQGSRRTMREALTKLADWASDGRCGPHDLPWHLLRIEHTAALRTRLTSKLAPATANSIASKINT